MIKEADIAGMLASAKGFAKDRLGNTGDMITKWYQSQPESVRDALRRGLIGAGIGGALAGGTALLNRDEDEGVGSAAMPALLGAVLGGTAGAGVTVGKGIMSGDIKIPGLASGRRRSITRRLGDTMTGALVHSYGPVLGGLAPLSFKSTRETLGNFINKPRGPKTRLNKMQLATYPLSAGLGYLAQKAIAGDY